jgi:hypothetical protein
MILNGVLIGGNCGDPVEKAADVYVGFDGCFRQHGGLPWEARPATNVYYPITDGDVPQNLERFQGLVTWACNQLQAGKVVHMGCIGGHGRTGTVFAAIVKQALGEADAIAWVRKNYCAKAVETDKQVAWLNKHFGITVQPGSKAHTLPEGGFQPLGATSNADWWGQKHGKGGGKDGRAGAERAASGPLGGTKRNPVGPARPAYDDGPASVAGASAGALSQIKPMASSPLDIWTDPAVRRQPVAPAQ